MKRGLLLLFWLLIAYAGAHAQDQARKGRGGHHSGGGSCNEKSDCFSTEIVSAQKTGETCTEYKLKVIADGNCRHALSHYTVAIPCGKVKDLRNSENWKQVFGYDPTTHLTGFKIDDICNFGEDGPDYFYIRFTLCSYDSACDTKLKCWEPIVAYKASTNVYYDTLAAASCEFNLEASLQKHDATCFGVADGSLSVEVSEGEEPFTYTWSNGATTASITGLAAGTYSVVVKDAAGAEVTLTGTITQPDAIAISGAVVNATCAGNANGSIDVTTTGGHGGYTYTWNTGATTEDLTALKSGTYIVTVKDSTGCSAQKTFTVTNTSVMTLSATAVLPTCTQSNGSINITVTGGTAPYTYLWSNGATTEDLQNLAAGVYKITVTDNSGCTAELAYNLRENNTLRLDATVTQTNCTGDPTGAVNLIVTGGVPPYTYQWSNGATTEDLSSLLAGLYKVTVTDANGCTSMLQVNVSKKTFNPGNQIVQPLCHGENNGSITLNPSGGVAPYTYQWSNGSTGNAITDLAPGAYTVTVTDAEGCSVKFTFVINNPMELVASAIVSNTQCNAEGNFSIDLTVSGGKAPYTYVWSNGATTQDIDSLQSGTYTVVITDANGCTLTKSVTVSGSSSGFACLITPADSIPSCGSTGNALSTPVTGGTYQWSVQSSDNKWAITGGSGTSSIVYTAGGENSSATFTLSITKDGCTQTCSYNLTSCTGETPGGGDPGGGDPGGGGDDDETCEECFDSSIKFVSSDGSCKTYTVTVSTDGNCRHELSHWDIAIPCGTLKNYSNSEGWKMEIGKDPTTGLNGLKVDDIDGFGKEPDSFTVTFTICFDNACHDVLRNWDPVVAYKAGQCIAYDTLGLEYHHDDDDPKVCAYPNPFHGNIRFDWKCDEDDYVELDIIDKCGREVHKVYRGNVWKGESYSFECSGSDMNDDLYIYRFTSSKKRPVYGKLIKKH